MVKQVMLICSRCGRRLTKKQARYYKGRPYGAGCCMLIKRIEKEKEGRVIGEKMVQKHNK